jgi:hypothetical protein
MSEPYHHHPEPPFGEHIARTREQIIGLGQAFAQVPVPTLFELVRVDDPTGLSGLGRIAHGMIFPMHGGAVYQWHSDPPRGWHHPIRQYGLFASIAEILAVHGHCGATVLRTLDVMDIDASQLNGRDDRGAPEAFVIVDGSGDVPEWGVWLPQEDHAVTWASPITPISGRRQADRHTVWRSMGSLSARVGERTGPSRGSVVWLTSSRGRRIVHASREYLTTYGWTRIPPTGSGQPVRLVDALHAGARRAGMQHEALRLAFACTAMAVLPHAGYGPDTLLPGLLADTYLSDTTDAQELYRLDIAVLTRYNVFRCAGYEDAYTLLTLAYEHAEQVVAAQLLFRAGDL